MLWYKGWLETGSGVVVMTIFAWVFSRWWGPHHVQVDALFLSFVPVFLAGSGTETQHLLMKNPNSIYFTLSLPVSRFRLFATRAGLGMLETVGIFAIAPCAKWVLFIGPEDHVSRSDLFAFWVSLSACASAFYFLGVLLKTFLDESQKRSVGIVGLVFLWVLLSVVPLPAPVNIFQAMFSPLSTHSLPWASMGISLGAAAILCFAAMRVVQTREY